MNPVDDDDYQSFTDQPISGPDMEALTANAEQEVDVDQAIVHNMYIGWVMALLHTQTINSINHKGGNQVVVDMGAFEVTLVIPYPPPEWEP